MKGHTKDGVYEWLVSSPILAFSSIQTSSSAWHHRLKHPALSILKLNISNNKLGSSSSLFSSNSFCISCLCNKSHKLSFSKSTILSSHPFETIFSDVWTHLSSPYETIFGTAPNYSKLQILDCLCYPWLPPYTTYKLDSCFKPCVFIGYYLTQSAYYCLDPSTSKIYVSRHVKFVESSFPFIHLSPTSPRPQPNYVATWFPKTPYSILHNSALTTPSCSSTTLL